ncbi:uroporphyrinogen-III C-methyltransferase [Natronoglycomyces albus]|uniref:Uroporphyrinogen-III C-methyltransferase n=1 Tax=Natronoglycomyces albus TaxID=2811108 RepID=A0A895XUC1_9ACTN|nr:uroporphyrinogen-III C-methyltransferase [Natronoglycomyces albus]
MGLRLSGRRVLVVGGGSVAARRVPRLLSTGAQVHIISPRLTTTLSDLARRGDLSWSERTFRPTDVDGAWLVLAATDDHDANEQIARECEKQRTFCSRADDAEDSTAWAAATTSWDGLQIAVLASGDPLRAKDVRQQLSHQLQDGDLGARRRRAKQAPVGVALVGAGPGDADLITLRGLRLLQRAEVVISDRLVPLELLDVLDDDVELIDAAKLPYGRHTTQEAINTLLVQRASAGKFVVRLKGGDGFVFGRGAEEIDACVDAGIPVHVVPGISSSIAGPAAAGIPVTERGVVHDFTVVSGHVPPLDPTSRVNWEALAASNGTLILLMAVKNRAEIAAALLAGGKDAQTPVRIVENATTVHQLVRDTTLGGLAECEVRSPAVIVIGEVAARSRSVQS